MRRNRANSEAAFHEPRLARAKGASRADQGWAGEKDAPTFGIRPAAPQDERVCGNSPLERLSPLGESGVSVITGLR